MEKREKLDALFRPKAVAIVGASDKYDQISGRPVTLVDQDEFRGALFFQLA